MIFRRALKIFGVVYLLAGLIAWGWDVYSEWKHPDDYIVVEPNGVSEFNTKQFVVMTIEHALPMILFWPPIVALQIELRANGTCNSAEIGKC